MLDRFASKRRLPEAIVLDIENTRDSLPQEFRGRIRNVAVRVEGNEPAVTGVAAAKGGCGLFHRGESSGNGTIVKGNPNVRSVRLSVSLQVIS